jgi:dienelactone hydrolase
MIPKGSGPFPAVIFLHWGPGDKSEFNADATALAMAGVISLSIDAPFVRETWDHNKGDSMYIQTVLDLRRGADLLLARTDVDPSRLGFCGHSYGATWGGVLAGVDKRFKGFVLMAGDPEIGNCAACKEPASPKYWAIHYIGHASPAALLFQFARQDEYITKEAADKYYAAASDPKTVIWYDTNHAFNEQAQLDRLNWLKTLFGI